MIASAVIYLALIHRSKMQLRRRLAEFGLLIGADCRVRTEPKQFVLVSPARTYHWPNEGTKVSYTDKGILVCPEPYLFILIPKNSAFEHEDFKSFRKRILSRGK